MNRETGKMEYLLDRILGLEKHERITEDAITEMLKEAVQTSYRRGGEESSLEGTVSKQTVKVKLHGLKFPKDTKKPEKKKEVEYLYIEADEDHVSLQFREREIILSTQMLKSEKNRHGILGKYVEAMTHNVSLDTKKKVYFNEHIWGL